MWVEFVGSVLCTERFFRPKVTVFIHLFFTRKYACSMKICLKFGVHLITEYFCATIAFIIKKCDFYAVVHV